MRSCSVPTFALALIPMLAYVPALAQSADTSRTGRVGDVWLGPLGGGVWSSHSGVPSGVPFSFDEVDADGFGWAAGLDATIRLAPEWYIAPIMSFESWWATSSRAYDVPLAMIDDGGEDTVDRRASVSAETEIEYTVLRDAMLFGVVVLGDTGAARLALEVGPTFCLVVVGHVRQQVRLDPSEPGRFANPNGLPTEKDGRTMVYFDSNIPGRVGGRIGMLGGLRAWFRIAPVLDAWAALRYDVALTDVVEAGRWRASAILLTAGVQLGL